MQLRNQEEKSSSEQSTKSKLEGIRTTVINFFISVFSQRRGNYCVISLRDEETGYAALPSHLNKSRKENPQKLTQLSSRSHPRHLVGKRTAQKDTIIDITSDSQVNSNFPYRWSPASLTFNNYFYLFLYLYIT